MNSLNFFIKPTIGRTICRTYNNGEKLTKFIQECCSNQGILIEDVYVVCCGRIVHGDEEIHAGHTYQIWPRLIGGKGGFGSMLRAIGAQIEKTTNREACRDLSGRRMRDVNNEKKLREWVGKAADREREREQRRRDRMERRRQEPRHKFDDPDYEKQKALVAEGLEDALTTGLQKAGTAPSTSTVAGPSTSRKRKATSTETTATKKACEWLGIDESNLSDLSSDSDSDDSVKPGPSGEGGAADSGHASPSIQRLTDEESAGDSGVDVSKQRKEETNDSTSMESMEVDTMSPPRKEEAKLEEMQTEMSHKESKDVVQVLPPKKEKSGLLEALAAVPPANLAPQVAADTDPVDLEMYNNKEELEVLGLERLKFALTSRKLKCGGTLQERADRLFSVKGLTPDQIHPSLFAKPSKGKKK